MKRKTPLLRKKNIKREARRRRLRIITMTLGTLLLLAGIVVGAREALTRFEFFSLKKIIVLGEPKTLSEAEILQHSGLRIGTNLFKIKIQEVQQRLKQHPFFKIVTVQRRLPNTMVIEVQEYSPEFILNTGRFYYVDADGEIFKDITDSNDKRDYVILSGISDEMILSEAAKTKEAIQQAVELKKIYSQSQFFENLGLSEIAYEKNIGFTLYPETKKYSIKFGLRDFSDKMKRLTEFWDQIEKSNAKVSSIDLNYPGKILVTL